MVRTLRLRNFLLRTESSSSSNCFDKLVQEMPEYTNCFTDLIYTRQWVRDVAASPIAMKTISLSDFAMEAISASATAMEAISASATAMEAISKEAGAIQVVIETQKFLSAVAASSVAMSAVAASSVAMSAVAASSVAMQAVAKSAAACQAIETAIQTHRTTLFSMLSNNSSSCFTKTTKSIGSGSGSWDDGQNTATIYIPTSCNDDGDTDYDVSSLFAGNLNLVRIPRHRGSVNVTQGVGMRGVRVVGTGSSSGSVTFDIFTAK